MGEYGSGTYNTGIDISNISDTWGFCALLLVSGTNVYGAYIVGYTPTLGAQIKTLVAPETLTIGVTVISNRYLGITHNGTFIGQLYNNSEL